MSIIDMTLPKWAIFTMRVYGEICHFCRIQLKFGFWLHKKRWHTSWKFQLEIRSNNKLSPKSCWQTYMKWTVLVYIYSQFYQQQLWFNQVITIIYWMWFFFPSFNLQYEHLLDIISLWFYQLWKKHTLKTAQFSYNIMLLY